MSWLSVFLHEQRRKWAYRSRFERIHRLRRNLAYYVVKHGFEIGDYSYGAPIVQMWNDGARLKVGKYCSIGPEVEFILGGNHHLDHVTTYPLSKMAGPAMPEGPFTRGDIVVGSDVWIGYRAVFLSGVTVGDGAIVGACAVVAKDVPPYAIVVGNPARIVRKRFSEDQIEKLLALRWWNLPDDAVRSLRPMLQSNNVEAFLAEHQRYAAMSTK